MGVNAKANVATAIPELIQIVSNPFYEEDRKEKHVKRAENGWYKYDILFALPVYENEILVGYNAFSARLCREWEKVLVRYFGSKKETNKPQQ